MRKIYFICWNFDEKVEFLYISQEIASIKNESSSIFKASIESSLISKGN